METKDKCITSESLKYVHDKVYDDLYGKDREIWNVIPKQTVQFQLDSDSGMYLGSIDFNDDYLIEDLPAIQPIIDGEICDVNLSYIDEVSALGYVFLREQGPTMALVYNTNENNYMLMCASTKIESCIIEASCYLGYGSASTANMIKRTMSKAIAPKVMIDILSEPITIDSMDYQAQIVQNSYAPLGDPLSEFNIKTIIYYITELKRPIAAIINRPDGSVFQSQASVQHGALVITYLYRANTKLCADQILFIPEYNTQYGMIQSFSIAEVSGSAN